VPDQDDELFGKRRKRPQYTFIGEVLAYDADQQIVTVQQRNNFGVDDTVEFYGPNFRHHQQVVADMWDDEGQAIDRAPHAMQIITFHCATPVQPGDFLRKQK